MLTVLVLCTGNSCRSVMAEALINHLGKGRYQAFSAGSHPAGYVHPGSLQTLTRHGIAFDEPYSKSWNDVLEQPFDIVITVCDEAANETCPVFLGDCKKLHWSTPDPAHVDGSASEIDAAFDQAFDMLQQRIKSELL
ncbi:arsenate reductase ArsC [Halieaceae bacterium IMCC14734]|uniref:Arsenate reductase ArsC n=1 Tax=Candidatus Litorirhabdus singularis TaxID=2518993 RepID=A0ABT3TC32_9GAMM|nr:arsenate reductase ArsC [Candidatus Litorirhabdus singularis]MCX2979851.1 arsenate reductase ArsC [Candidatus Litorirhabdus singularis]